MSESFSCFSGHYNISLCSCQLPEYLPEDDDQKDNEDRVSRVMVREGVYVSEVEVAKVREGVCTVECRVCSAVMMCESEEGTVHW